MPLTTCTDCQRDVSTNAPSCPHCGARRREGRSSLEWAVRIALGLLVVWLVLQVLARAFG